MTHRNPQRDRIALKPSDIKRGTRFEVFESTGAGQSYVETSSGTYIAEGEVKGNIVPARATDNSPIVRLSLDGRKLYRAR